MCIRTRREARATPGSAPCGSPTLPMLLSASWSVSLRNFVQYKYPRSRLMTQTMLPASRSSGVQCLSESRVARLIHAMGRTEPPGCSCSRVAPKPSIQASQYTRKGRERRRLRRPSTGRTKLVGRRSRREPRSESRTLSSFGRGRRKSVLSLTSRVGIYDNTPRRPSARGPAQHSRARAV